ncbi:MAG: TPM domain-containing protein [Spirochaetota bacterium]
MKNYASAFLTDSDKGTITNKVHEAERQTSGEIVPYIASSSYSYPRANLIAGMLAGLFAGMVPAVAFNNHNVWIFLLIFLPVFAAMQWIVEFIPPLKRLFISSEEIDAEVREAAITAFYRHGLYRTRDETGVLIYISIFERRVCVLADRGIDSVVDASAWQGVVDTIVAGIKSGNHARALAEAVGMVGDLLREKFPAKKDDTDELHNLIIEE